MYLTEQKALKFITANRKKKKREMESAKQGRCYTLQEKITEANVFLKS